MAKTASIYTRVEPEVKIKAEKILGKMGISMSSAMGMFLNQIVLHRGIPFEMKLPSDVPLAFPELTKEQLASEMQKGLDDIKAGRVCSAESVDEEFKKDFGI